MSDTLVRIVITEDNSIDFRLGVEFMKVLKSGTKEAQIEALSEVEAVFNGGLASVKKDLGFEND